MAMMAMPDVTGLATSCVAHSTRSSGVSLVFFGSCARCATTFSTTTTAASTSRPIAIARPPRLIRLADSPNWRISTKVASTDSGRISATTMAARRLPRNRISRITTSTAASSSALLTVPTARSTSCARS